MEPTSDHLQLSKHGGSGGGGDGGVMEAYRPLPLLYFSLMLIWFILASSWTFNTFKNRRFQTNKLQWALSSVPLIKVLQLALAFLFWYSCFHLQICSLWPSFGVYVTGILFQTATFVSFILVSHGYCITCERLSLHERRTTAALGCVFYLTLVGYRASLPYFWVLLVINYLVLFYIIFHHVAENLVFLREQLHFIDDEDINSMHDAIYKKYIMFKKFQGAMQILAVAELAVLINMDNSLDNYWLRLLLREWAQFCIFLYVGWTFRSQYFTPRFSIMPTLKHKGERNMPPIYRIEMNAETFDVFKCNAWHIGVATSQNGTSEDSVVVVIQHPMQEC